MLVFRWAGSNSWNSINGFNSEAKKYRCERKFHLEKNGVNESKYLTQKMNYFQRKWHSEVGKKLSVNLCITWTFLWLQLGFCFTAEMQQRHNTVLFWKQNNLFQCFLHFRNICAQHIPRPQAWGKNVRQREGETLKIYGTVQRLTPPGQCQPHYQSISVWNLLHFATLAKVDTVGLKVNVNFCRSSLQSVLDVCVARHLPKTMMIVNRILMIAMLRTATIIWLKGRWLTVINLFDDVENFDTRSPW